MGTKVRDIIKKLKVDGWIHQGTEGSHRQFEHPTQKYREAIGGEVLSKTKIITGFPEADETGEYGATRDEVEVGLADSNAWPLVTADAPVVKAPTTRLLDMLAGWLKYVERDEFPDSEAVGERIADLYQEAGQFASGALTPEEAKALISAFLTDRVVPTLLLTGE